ncbi:hypothetical protein ACTVZO_38845 [Streptomyces sp. IBSNAI002]|uniref:hypothetical protein n=1 Tax=Streptomyces sp. IBSNAI002 TaxID=3457500 RepID=UPI003FD4D5C9
METTATAPAWIGYIPLPAGEPGKTADVVLQSAWSALFSSWISHQESTGALSPAVKEAADKVRDEYHRFETIRKTSASDLDSSDRILLEVYPGLVEQVTRHLPEFMGAVEQARPFLEKSPAGRMVDNRAPVRKQVRMHMNEYKTAQAYISHYSRLADLLYIPEEINTGTRESGYAIKEGERKKFGSLGKAAAELKSLTERAKEDLSPLYRAGDPTAKGPFVWSVFEVMSKDERNQLPQQLQEWYTSLEGYMPGFLDKAAAIHLDYEKLVIKIAAGQVEKALAEVDPNYAAAVLALRGLAAATGIAAATAAPAIGPLSLLIGAGAAGISRSADTLSKKRTKRAVTKSVNLRENGLAGKVVKDNKLVKRSKVASNALAKIEEVADQVTTQVTAADAMTGGVAGSAVNAVMDGIGLGTSTLVGTVGMAYDLSNAATGSRIAQKFPEHVEEKVRRSSKASAKERRLSMYDRSRLMQESVDVLARVLSNAQMVSARSFDSISLEMGGEKVAGCTFGALMDAVDPDSGTKGKKYFKFTSYNVFCEESDTAAVVLDRCCVGAGQRWWGCL